MLLYRAILIGPFGFQSSIAISEVFDFPVLSHIILVLAGTAIDLASRACNWETNFRHLYHRPDVTDSYPYKNCSNIVLTINGPFTIPSVWCSKSGRLMYRKYSLLLRLALSLPRAISAPTFREMIMENRWVISWVSSLYKNLSVYIPLQPL